MKPRILVVDDSAFALRRVRAILEGAGYEVLEAEDGLTALRIYASSQPDVVLLDLVMRGMRGLEVLAKLRNSIERQRSSCFLLTFKPRPAI